MLRWISPVVAQHKGTLVPGVPQLNMCDAAVMVRPRVWQPRDAIWTNVFCFFLFSDPPSLFSPSTTFVLSPFYNSRNQKKKTRTKLELDASACLNAGRRCHLVVMGIDDVV